MRRFLGILTIAVFAFLTGCKELSKEGRTEIKTKAKMQEKTFHTPSLWVAKRVTKAKSKPLVHFGLFPAGRCYFEWFSRPFRE